MAPRTVNLFVVTQRRFEPWHVYEGSKKDEWWFANLCRAKFMAKHYDEQLSAAIPEPALDPKNELMVQKKATFCDNLAQGKMRWQTIKSWRHNWDGQITNVVWMDLDEALELIRSGKVSSLSVLTSLYWRACDKW